MQIRRLTKREKIISVICVIMVFIFIGYNNLYKPFCEKIIYLDNKINKTRIKLKKDKAFLQRSQDNDEEYELYLEKYKQAQSSEQVMSSIFSEIEGVAKDLALRISELKPNRVKEEEHFNQFSVSLTIDSDFERIVHFIYLLQKEPYFFDIEELAFTKNLNRARQGNIKTHLILSKILIP